MHDSTQRSRRSFLQSAPLVAAGGLAACGQAEQQAAPAVQSQQRFKMEDGHHVAQGLSSAGHRCQQPRP